MKKIAFFALATLALMACQREVDVPLKSNVPTYTVTITASLAETRTAYDDAGKFSWVAGDKINVLISNGTGKKQVVFTTVEAGPEVQFTGQVDEGFQLTGEAAYALDFDAAKQKWVLPPSVTVDPEKPLASLPLFGAEDASELFQFKTATGILKFTVENAPVETGQTALFTMGNDSPALWGMLDAAPADGIVTMEALSGGGQMVFSNGAPAEANTTMTYWFFVPAGTLPADKTTFAVCDAEGNIIRDFRFTKAVTVAANRITSIAPVHFDPIKVYNRQTDSLALVAFYNAAKGAEWPDAKKWDLEKPMDTWTGITLKNNRVDRLVFTAATMPEAWTLPDEIGDLSELTWLKVNGNKLTGAIPETLYDLSKLTTLTLQNNNLTGSFSEKLGQLTELTDLYIDRNTNLTGSLPASIGQLKKLKNINIAKTGIGGAIPAELVGCTALVNFMAYECQLSGEVPDFWDQFANVGVIQLYNNPGLVGPLPASCGRATTTATNYSLRFDGCNFTGNIPESYANLPSACKQFWAKGNKLSGVVPEGVQKHANWSRWNAADNILPQQEGYGLRLEAYSRQTDSLALVAFYNAAKGAEWPDEKKWDLEKPMDTWTGITLKDKRVDRVIFTAATMPEAWTLPDEIGDLSELTWLKVNGNKLTGAIPETLYNLSKLTTLTLQNNNLTGSFSERLGDLTELTDLYIDRNTNLTGSLPASIGQLKKLKNINIAKTGIGGAIPAELVGCTALVNFMAYECQLSGEVPDFWDQFANVGIIQLYNNPGLVGSLPASCGRATTTATNYSLRFDGCNFTGNIPESYANLPSVCKQFWAKGNKLSGVIPEGVQKHANWSRWNATDNILPQQEGYGLTLE